MMIRLGVCVVLMRISSLSSLHDTPSSGRHSLKRCRASSAGISARQTGTSSTDESDSYVEVHMVSGILAVLTASRKLTLNVRVIPELYEGAVIAAGSRSHRSRRPTFRALS